MNNPDALRTPEQIREHYEIERELAARLRTASKSERRTLYPALYDELFRRVRHHPMLLTTATSPERVRALVDYQLRMLQPLLTPETVYLEIGPGECHLAVEMASRVKKVYAVDVSQELAGRRDTPPNFELIISDGTSIPVPPDSVDLAFSNQLMEHLHPEDAEEQLRNIYRALRPGGRYLCITPNRLTGPHDVSRGFDREATGFHLHEYTAGELDQLMRRVGFRDVQAYLFSSTFSARVPSKTVMFLESLVRPLSHRTRQALGANRWGEKLFGTVNMLATK